MKYKEKAKELVERFTMTENVYKEHADWEQAKQCALICVDEILKYLPYCVDEVEDKDIGYSDYYQQVKTEITKL